jgi:hypothetical protein
MVYINDQYRFIFIENPKSGSTSILNGLSKALNKKLLRGLPREAHLTCKQIKERYPDKWNEYLKVSTYRDPVERYNSVLHHHHFKDKYSTIILLEKHLKNNKNCLYCQPQSNFTDGVDFLIHLDNIQNDFDRFCEKIGIKSVKLTIDNVCPLKVEEIKKIFINQKGLQGEGEHLTYQ